MRRRYDLFYALGALISSPVLGVGLLKTGKWRTDWKGRFGRTPRLPEDPRPTLLIHGVSVGEINATRELVARLTAPDAPPVRLVISATTNTGFDRAEELYGDRLAVVRFPFDFSWMVSRFLDAVRPDAVALMELEVWPNLAWICRSRGIPLAVINGRLSDESFKHYRWVRPFVGSMFGALDGVGAQTEEYALRFQALGVPPERITVTDTMKWDTVRLTGEVPGAEALRAAMGIDPERPLVVAGSTGPGEESLLIRGKPQGVQLMVVPRKPERFDEVAGLAPGMVRRTERPDGFDQGPAPGLVVGAESSGSPRAPTPDSSPAPDLFLLDTMGELTKAYSLADVAVVGRSFVPMGGSDPIEAIALGKPTITGPHHDNFRDVVAAFEAGGGIRVTDDPISEVEHFLADPEAGRRMGEAGREVIRERQGATERNAGMIYGLLGLGGDGDSSSSGAPSADEEGAGNRHGQGDQAGGDHSGSVPSGTSGAPGRSGKIRRWIFALFLLYMTAGYLTTAVDRISVEGGSAPSTPLPRLEGELLSGVFSVHTHRSHDARGTREDVGKAAKGAGLDFVVIGDHPPDSRRPGWAFWEPIVRDDVLIDGGQELRSPVAGKVLTVGVDTTYRRWEGGYDSFADMLEREGATSFVVHGRGPRGSERWVSPTVDGVQGWEVLDISEFARHRIRSFWGLYHALTLLVGTPLGLGDEALLHLMREGFDTPAVAAYDSFRVRRPLTATAGLNVHPKVRLGPLLVPSYGPFFRTLVTHVTVGDEWTAQGTATSPKAASADLMAGARTGDAFISVGGREAARGFRMGVVVGGMTLARMGGTAPFVPGARLRAGFDGGSGRRLLYRIVRNGEEAGWVLGDDLEWKPDGPGTYRVEVYTYSAHLGSVFVRLRPWIFGNPVDLRPAFRESPGGSDS